MHDVFVYQPFCMFTSFQLSYCNSSTICGVVFHPAAGCMLESFLLISALVKSR